MRRPDLRTFRPRGARWGTLPLLATLLLAACGDGGDDPEPGDTQVDADASTGGGDAGTDVRRDASRDVAPDVEPDVPGEDVVEEDVQPDAEPDVAPDAEPDVAPDAEPDASNLPPIPETIAVETDEDTPIAVSLGAVDPEGDDLTFALVSLPSHGVFEGSGDDWQYVPEQDYFGDDSFAFSVTDGTNLVGPVTVAITVRPVNDLPVVTDGDTTLDEDGSGAIALTGTDVEGDPLSFRVVDGPANGELEGSGSDWTYRPAPDFHGTDSFRWVANDGSGDSGEATWALVVNPFNDAPVATDAGLTTPESTQLQVLLVATDVDGDDLSFTIVSEPDHGTLSGEAPNLVYTPDEGFVGEDSFSWRANDGTVDSNDATLSISVTLVNDAPEAADGSGETLEDTPVDLVLEATDADEDALTFAIVDGPDHGTLTGDAPNLTYTPDADFFGEDRFTWSVTDGNATVERAFTIAVLPVNDAPTLAGGTIEIDEDTPGALALAPADVDSDTLTVRLGDAPANGTVAFEGFTATYAPNSDFHGEDSFTVIANDGELDSAPATVAVTVRPVNDRPEIASVDLDTLEDTALDFSLVATDTDGDTLTFSIPTPPTDGTLEGDGPAFTFTPNENFHGTVSFLVLVNDGTVDSEAALVTIEVLPVNDAPVAVDPGLQEIEEDTELAIVLEAFDVENDTLAWELIAGPSNGTLEGDGPGFIYTPDRDFHGEDAFQVRVGDGNLSSDVLVVSISVLPVNDAPVANAGDADTDEDTAVEILLTASDVDGDDLAFAITLQPANGTLTLDGATATYTPDANFNGPDFFEFTVADAEETSAPARITIDVAPVNDAPTVADFDVTTDEDTTVEIVLTGSDIDGDALTFQIVETDSLDGTLEGAGASWVFTPARDFNGTTSFTFRANDGALDSDVATVTIEVGGVNDAPIALAQSVQTPEDEALAITLTGTDADGDDLTFTIVDAPAHGTLEGTPPALTFVPDADYFGGDTFTFQVSDGSATSAPATIEIAITAVNDAPIASAEEVETDEDTAVDITLTATDIDSTDLGWEIVDAPAHGTLSGTVPALTYTPDADFFGTDTFTFRASDEALSSETVTITITVAPVNDAPVAQAQSVETDEDTALEITLAATDVDSAETTFAIVDGPDHGTLEIVGSLVTYTPDADFFGADAFTFRANDGFLDSATATVTITVRPVNDAPVAEDTGDTTDEDTSLALTLVATDVENDPLTWEIVDAPAHGSLSGSGSSRLYSPDADFHGVDTFTFRANDGLADSNTATFTITVTPVNDAPVALAQSLSTDEDEDLPLTLAGTDVDGDTLTFRIVASPASGSLSGTGASRTYAPDANFFGTDSFTFVVNDGTVDSPAATIVIDVRPVNDVPVADAQSVTLDEDTEATITLTGSDIDGDPLGYTIIDAPVHGELSGAAPAIKYLPNPNYNGPDSFSFRVNDGTADSDVAVVSLTVRSVNDAPVAEDDTVDTNEDTSVPVTLAATDVDGDDLTWTILSPPANGSLSGNAPNLTFTPDEHWFGTDSFTFRVSDGALNSNTATITIQVAAVNDAPVASDGSSTLDEDTFADIVLVANDVENDTLAWTIVTPPAHGALTGTGANRRYTPNANFNGSDAFTFRVNDGQANSNTATFTLTINPVDDLPYIVSQELDLDEDGSVEFTVDYGDIDGDAVVLDPVQPPSKGNIEVAGATFTYTPFPNANGQDFVSARVRYPTQSVGEGTLGTITFNIRPIDDAPVAQDDDLSTDEDADLAIVLQATDVDGDPITAWTITGQPAIGTLTGTAPNLTYVPDADAFGPDELTFTVTANGVVSNEATVSITVLSVNDRPVVSGRSYRVNPGASVDLEPDASDVENDPLAITTWGSPAEGFVEQMSDLVLSYTADPEASATQVTVPFTVSDGDLDASATFTIDINQYPTVEETPEFLATGNTLLEVSAEDGLANGIEDDFGTPTVVADSVQSTEGGDVVIEDDGAFTYLPPVGFQGTDSFEYRVQDAEGLVAWFSATVTVSGMIWYVDNTAGEGGDGRQPTPFRAMGYAEEISEDGDIIQIAYGDGTSAENDSGFSLKPGQTLRADPDSADMPVIVGPIWTATGSSVTGLEIEQPEGGQFEPADAGEQGELQFLDELEGPGGTTLIITDVLGVTISGCMVHGRTDIYNAESVTLSESAFEAEWTTTLSIELSTVTFDDVEIRSFEALALSVWNADLFGVIAEILAEDAPAIDVWRSESDLAIGLVRCFGIDGEEGGEFVNYGYCVSLQGDYGYGDFQGEGEGEGESSIVSGFSIDTLEVEGGVPGGIRVLYGSAISVGAGSIRSFNTSAISVEYASDIALAFAKVYAIAQEGSPVYLYEVTGKTTIDRLDAFVAYTSAIYGYAFGTLDVGDGTVGPLGEEYSGILQLENGEGNIALSNVSAWSYWDAIRLVNVLGSVDIATESGSFGECGGRCVFVADSGTVSLRNLSFNACGGQAIGVEGTSDVTLSSNTFDDCGADPYGGQRALGDEPIIRPSEGSGGGVKIPWEVSFATIGFGLDGGKLVIRDSNLTVSPAGMGVAGAATGDAVVELSSIEMRNLGESSLDRGVWMFTWDDGGVASMNLSRVKVGPSSQAFAFAVGIDSTLKVDASDIETNFSERGVALSASAAGTLDVTIRNGSRLLSTYNGISLDNFAGSATLRSFDTTVTSRASGIGVWAGGGDTTLDIRKNLLSSSDTFQDGSPISIRIEPDDRTSLPGTADVTLLDNQMNAGELGRGALQPSVELMLESDSDAWFRAVGNATNSGWNFGNSEVSTLLLRTTLFPPDTELVYDDLRSTIRAENTLPTEAEINVFLGKIRSAAP